MCRLFCFSFFYKLVLIKFIRLINTGISVAVKNYGYNYLLDHITFQRIVILYTYLRFRFRYRRYDRGLYSTQFDFVRTANI